MKTSVPIVLPILLTCALLVVIGCENTDEGGPDPSLPPEQLIREGWVLYERGDFESAIETFGWALRPGGVTADVYHGFGWSWLRLDSPDDAVRYFDLARAEGFDGPDPFAGKALALNGIDPVDLRLVAVYAESALARDERYHFSHDTLFDWRDLRVFLAQYGFSEQRYDLASAQVESLGGELPYAQSPFFARELEAEIEKLAEVALANPFGPRRARLEVARRLWRSRAPRSYEFEYSTSGYRYFVGPIRILVVDDQPVSGTLVETQEPVTDQELHDRYDVTIERLFTWLEIMIELGPDVLDVEYDSARGFPRRIYFDGSLGVADDENRWTATLVD